MLVLTSINPASTNGLPSAAEMYEMAPAASLATISLSLSIFIVLISSFLLLRIIPLFSIMHFYQSGSFRQEDFYESPGNFRGNPQSAFHPQPNKPRNIR